MKENIVISIVSAFLSANSGLYFVCRTEYVSGRTVGERGFYQKRREAECFSKYGFGLRCGLLCFILLNGLTMLFCLNHSCPASDRIRLLTLSSILLTAACTDVKWRRIPNDLILSALVLRIILYFPDLFCGRIPFWYPLIRLLISFAIPILLSAVAFRIVPRGIGMGDVKMMAVIVFYLGFREGLEVFLLSFLSLIPVTVFLLCSREVKKPFPLGPAFLAGTILSYFCNFN